MKTTIEQFPTIYIKSIIKNKHRKNMHINTRYNFEKIQIKI